MSIPFRATFHKLLPLYQRAYSGRVTIDISLKPAKSSLRARSTCPWLRALATSTAEVAVQDVKLPHKGANSPGFGTARMTGYEPLTSYIHQTDFRLSTDNQVEECIGGKGMLKETNNYMVLLNYELPKALPVLWGQARVHICADGGTNRLYDDLPLFLPDQDPEEVRLRHVPEVITGDLDSIRKEVLQFYVNLGSVLIDKSLDQDTNDFGKVCPIT
mmetsp:Transcript_10204/g.17560  ORF Transcript_10204/g.17560 Transcript_10204/m.17560 type:complete len:216 (-) Transcript_10204:719-1366(-)